MGGILNGPIPDTHLPLTPKPVVEKSPFQVSANRVEIDENVKKHIGWLRSDAMNNSTAFTKAKNKWTQIKRNTCDRQAA